jgi:mRNA interferase RelE/StbE
MAEFRIEIGPAAKKEFAKLPREIQIRIKPAIDSLRFDPRPQGDEKIQGLKDCFRLRVGQFRVIYQVHDQEVLILVLAIGDRKDIYRKVLAKIKPRMRSRK